MDEAADEAGAKDLARDLRSMSNPRSAAAKQFKKTAGLDELEKDFERGFEDDDVEDEGARDTTSSSYGTHTKELAEKRASEAKARRDEAVRRANERAASFKGFETAETTPAPAPGEGAPADSPEAEAEPEPLRQDKA
jgi:sec-independent protein translocase protein TatB